jgi:hypothetical protein
MQLSLLDEIKAVNYAFLSIVRGVAQSKDTARLTTLGVSDEMAQQVACLSDVQLEKLALSGQLLCRFQMHTAHLLSVLSNPAASRLAQMRAEAATAVPA